MKRTNVYMIYTLYIISIFLYFVLYIIEYNRCMLL
uniref:Uncharacterized protein n=1 Tax=viral metagenome TaxID=1070528 RepID=A0A6C0LLV0_9ZZZZ